MRKNYVLYMLGMGVSVVALAARMTIIYPEYIESIFNLVNMILLTSILVIFFLEGKYKLLMNKFLIMSGFFFLLSWGINILKNILIVNSFGLELMQIFIVLFMMCGVGSILLTSISLYDEKLVEKYSLALLLWLPVLVYTLWVVFNNPFIIGNIVYRSVSFRLFLLVYVSSYSFTSTFLFAKRASQSLPLREKLVVMSIGLLVFQMSDVLREVGLFSPVMSTFSLCGMVIVCFSFLFEPTLAVYNELFNKMLLWLDDDKKKDFMKELKKQVNKHKVIRVEISDVIRVVDNPRIVNIVEKKAYDKVLVEMIKWYSKNRKDSDKLIRRVKKDYSFQMRLARRTAPLFI